MKLFSIIVTYNGEKWIKKCVESVVYNSSVIIVDNGSTDRTTQIIEKLFPQVILIKAEKNLGFGAANNIGIKHALNEGADYIFLLNQDAWIRKGALKILVEFMQSNNEYGVISPIHLNGEGDMLDFNFGDYLYRNGGRTFITDKILGRESKQIIDIDFVNAAAWLISKKCIMKVGYFDPIFFHYGEDNNYLQRVRYHSFKIGILSSVFVYHDREGSTSYFNKNEFDLRIRVLKIKWADVNNEEAEIAVNISKTVKSLIQSQKRTFLKSIGINSYKRYKRHVNKLKKLVHECENSRIKNRKVLSKPNKEKAFIHKP